MFKKSIAYLCQKLTEEMKIEADVQNKNISIILMCI